MKYLLVRERVRRKNFLKIESKYLALKAIIHNQKLSITIRWEASLLLSKLMKRNSLVSFKNRCFLTGRRRGYFSFFNLSRIQALNLARNNELPFVMKASW